MRTELLVKSRSLTGSSGLTLLAPIKAGLVPSLDTLSYKTRVKRLLKTWREPLYWHGFARAKGAIAYRDFIRSGLVVDIERLGRQLQTFARSQSATQLEHSQFFRRTLRYTL